MVAHFNTHFSLITLPVCAVMQVITLEGWVDIMYYVMDAHSFYNFIYFIFLIIVSAHTRLHKLRTSGGVYCTVCNAGVVIIRWAPSS